MVWHRVVKVATFVEEFSFQLHVYSAISQWSVISWQLTLRAGLDPLSIHLFSWSKEGLNISDKHLRGQKAWTHSGFRWAAISLSIWVASIVAITTTTIIVQKKISSRVQAVGATATLGVENTKTPGNISSYYKAPMVEHGKKCHQSFI